MKPFWRRSTDGGGAATAVADQPDLGQLSEKIARLTAADTGAATPERAREILRARHEAAIRLLDGAAPDPAFAEPDATRLPPGPLPELTPDILTGSLLRAAILRDGCALVRGLIPRERALDLAARIDAAYAHRDEGATGAGLYEEFAPHDRFGEVEGRGWIQGSGGLLGADSPVLLDAFLRTLADAGVDRLAGDYLGEPELISVQKTTMRRADPSLSGEWHQDGRFMGPVRSLNLWLSLSRCGDLAPGLDIVPTRLDLVESGTDDAPLEWVVSDTRARLVAGEAGVVRPIFEPGDALLFDEVFLHKTAAEPTMPNPRHAVENWFFGASSFPGAYAPIAVSV